MKYIGEEYEKHFEVCEKCGTRRPKGTLCRWTQKEKLVCIDVKWCKLQADAVKLSKGNK